MPAIKKSAVPPANGRLPELSTAVEPLAPKATKDPNRIEIPTFNFQTVQAKIIGVTPLICNAFPDKLAQQWQDEREVDSALQAPTKAKGGKKNRPARDYDAEFHNSLYPLEDVGGYGFPAIAFKKAIVGATRQVSNLDMVLGYRIFFVKGPYRSKGFACVKINGKPRSQRDVVRLADMKRTPDIRFRGLFFPWSAVLEIEYNASMISPPGVLNLLQYAGKCEGVGEWRPSSKGSCGDNGQFRIAEKGD